MSGMNPVAGVFQLQWALAALYGIDANGNPTGAALWSAKCFNQISVKDELAEKLTRPTGVRFENNHHVNQQSTVTISGLQDLIFPSSLMTTLQRDTYFVLYLQWQASDNGVPGQTQANPVWTDRTYYFCKHKLLDGGASGGDPGQQSITVRGQFYLQRNGVGSVPSTPNGYV